jgi:class 3 adenylate cyclase
MGDVAEWLERLGLSRYRAVFAERDIDCEILPDLTDQDLEKLGLSLGHRKKLLRAIAELARPDSAVQRELEAAPRTAERRQLTVLFCDLVGSTSLAAWLDPEDLRGVMRAYHRATAAVIQRFDGHVAKYLGDGVVAYFGWPSAHEDDAELAVRAALQLIETVARLDAHPEVRLQARAGIATGIAVVGDLVGEGAAREEAVVGEMPNLAARLQALAAPGSVVISQATRRLIGGLFELDDLGPQRFKGFAEPLAAWRVVGEGQAEGRFEARQGARLTPLVGRDEELALLLRRWRQAQGGDGQVVLLSGEPGIGKSRLVREVRERLRGEPHVRLLYQCSPHHTTSPLHPVIAQLERAAQFERDDPPEARLAKLEALLGRGTDRLDQAVPLIAALLGVPLGEVYQLPELTPQRQKQLTLEALVEQLDGLVAEAPVLLAYEDAHWLDPTTQELLGMTIERMPRLPILLLVTMRPEFQPAWSGQPHVSALALTRLGRREGAAMVERVVRNKTLPAEVAAQIAAKTDGVPLFVEELTKTVLESGLLRDAGDHYELSGPVPSLAIPSTLHDSLLARLDRLAPVKEIAQIGAALGREFPHALLAAVADRPEPELLSALDQLVAAELVFRRSASPETTYSFKHALVQDAAYGTLLKSRRQQLHARIAEVLETQFPETAETQPELLAYHCAQAGLAETAVGYWCRAGEQALARSAVAEAAAQLHNGLELVKDLPEGANPRARELELQTALGRAMLGAKGWAAPETGRAYTRARELCDLLGETKERFPVLWGLTVFHINRGAPGTGRKVAEEMLLLAERQDDDALRIASHRALSAALYHLGEFNAARTHLNQVLSLYDDLPDRPPPSLYAVDHRAMALSFRATILSCSAIRTKLN